MTTFTRALEYRNPVMRGADVLCIQRALRTFGTSPVEPDGMFGTQTAAAVKSFQLQRGLESNGTVDQSTWTALLAAPEVGDLSRNIDDIVRRLVLPQRFQDSVPWILTSQGVAVNGQSPLGSPGIPSTVLDIWEKYGQVIDAAGRDTGVPIELIVATVAVESGGNPDAVRREPAWVSDDQTPDQISVGLMQTLISTARRSLQDPTVNADRLKDAKTSITAGTTYIASQFSQTGFDPPKVGCAYNAGGLYYNSSPGNPWRMRQFPLGTGIYATHMVAFFNDCFSLIRGGKIRTGAGPSFAMAMGGNGRADATV